MNYEQRIFDACPSFKERHVEFVAQWTEGSPSFANVLFELADHIALKELHDFKTELIAVLAVVEEIQTNAEKELKDAVNVYLLEELQSRSKENGVDADSYLELLGSHTKKWWNNLTQNWEAWHDW